MVRIEPLPMREIVDEEIRHACEDAERQAGISTSPRTYAKNPAAFKALGAFRAALAKESTLDPVLRELVRLKIAALNRERHRHILNDTNCAFLACWCLLLVRSLR